MPPSSSSGPITGGGRAPGGDITATPTNGPSYCALPLAMPDDWLAVINRLQWEGDVEALRRCVRNGAPYGSPRSTWVLSH